MSDEKKMPGSILEACLATYIPFKNLSKDHTNNKFCVYVLFQQIYHRKTWKKHEKLSSQQKIFRVTRPIKNGWNNNEINVIPYRQIQTDSQAKIIDRNLVIHTSSEMHYFSSQSLSRLYPPGTTLYFSKKCCMCLSWHTSFRSSH